MTDKLVSNIHWLGHSSFRIEGDGLVIYIDPWQLKDGPQADLILISHDHQDHCSPDDVAKIRGADTAVVANKSAAAKLTGSIEVVAPGDEVMVKGVAISAVPAYNINKFRSPGQPFHPQAAEHVGFVLTVGGRRIYFAGDTDHIPEMKDIKVDVALLPVSGTYVMTAVEAAEAAATIQPQVAVPMHIGRGIGSLDEAETFKQKAPVPVVVLAME
ncbi:MAG: MBL fold metallo-hydrolase [Ardenticatenaceae bacterium]|nr:MBL fold metallo-hydrolase [Ardenticatenaceae bacterium]MCB9443557.1 MBL fold metallo-hydrolase [Ardenticatenaceae bacterium]